MTTPLSHAVAATVIGLAGAAAAHATVTITQGGSAPTYAQTLTFDEAGGPTGTNLAADAFAGAGIAALVSGEGSNFVGDPASLPTWAFAGGDNAYVAPFGAFITLDQDVTAFSMQFWDNSGPPSGFGGGAAVIAMNDGVEVASIFVTPAYGGIGDAWFDIVATDGMVFDEVRALGFGFGPESMIDNLSWQPVPAPGAAAVLAVAGFAGARRRRM